MIEYYCSVCFNELDPKMICHHCTLGGRKEHNPIKKEKHFRQVKKIVLVNDKEVEIYDVEEDLGKDNKNVSQ